MSDYIYGSSLRAAKSKANYLFEGDFRRRPNQNLSGASRSMARVELLQQAAEQRQNRENSRRQEQASIKIQSSWRGFRCRKLSALDMRNNFDNMIDSIKSSKVNCMIQMSTHDFDKILREFIIFYHSEKDESRFNFLLNLTIANSDILLHSKSKDPSVWLHRLTKLLKMDLKLMDRHCSSSDLIHLMFLERFTRSTAILTHHESITVWVSLIGDRMYGVLRKLVDSHNSTSATTSQNSLDNDLNRLVIEVIRRSLDYQTPKKQSWAQKCTPLCSFFEQFLRGPLDNKFDSYYLPELLEAKPKCLNPSYIISEFQLQCDAFGHHATLYSKYFVSGFAGHQEHTEAIWFCYLFVRTLYKSIDQLSDVEKVEYVKILSNLIAPAEYVTNLSLMDLANNEDDQNDETPEDLDMSHTATQMSKYRPEVHGVISRLIELINYLPHINSLKSVIFSPESQPQLQSAVVRICNLMLEHEQLAIFSCRMLYTVAFNREFSRSLWKSIVTTAGTSLYGSNTPIYMQITRGSAIGPESWRSLIPKLRLFCSLCTYLLPTLDDGEFYTDDDESMFVDDKTKSAPPSDKNLVESGGSNFFFIDKELVGISAILRDMCVGFVEILYQGNQYGSSHQSRLDHLDEKSRILSFEMKLCFKSLVRLVCQLHAKDSRKQFCPDGHWICPNVVIPTNKAIDFQLVTAQQGRLLNHMTKENMTPERLSTTASEIKTVLILQEIPFIISFQDRVHIFHQLLRRERQIHHTENYHFGLPGTAIQVQIRRNYIYEDAFEKLSTENEPNMKLPLKVSLINAVGAHEAGIDGGGLTKEFLGELLKAGFDPMRGFFKSTKDNLLYPNPSANVLFSTLQEGYEIHYEFLGRMLGKAIFEKMMVELPLASFFIAKLLALKHSSDVDLHNLESLDPVLYKNLVYLKNYKGDVADLNLDFTISNNDLGEHEMVELKPGGSKIPVTRENKIEYVHLVADYRLNKQIRLQCAAFKRGLAQLIDLDWLRMFDPKELQILISGAPTVIDIADWRRNTVYANGYSDDCEAIQIFWKVVNLFDENQKRKLLKFATSCSLPPLLGFKDLVPQFAIAPSEETRLPTASTCMNLLKLPECEDEVTMRSKLLYAIESNAGFELS